MADTIVLKLGDFAFSAYEIPESIGFGGEQKLVTHKLPGGTRVVQAMGRDDAELTWSGLFLGENAKTRAKYLDYLRAQGKPLKLTWDDFQYTVLIESFTATYQRAYQIPYSIRCMVVSNETTSTTSIAVSGFDAAIKDDNKKAQDLGKAVDDKELTGLLGKMDKAIGDVASFAGKTGAEMLDLLKPVQAVAEHVQKLQTALGDTLKTVNTLGGIVPNSSLAKSVARVTSQLDVAAKYPLLTQLQSLTGRISNNMKRVNDGAAASHMVLVAGGNMMDVAATMYDDATKWVAIALANKKTDPNITGVVTLNVPVDAPDSGGVLA